MDPEIINELEENDMKVCRVYKKNDYGPISFVDKKNVLRYFLNSSYACLQPKTDKLLRLYKIENLEKKFFNCFWTPHEILSNFVYLNNSKNKNPILNHEEIKNSSIMIPDCFRFFAGQLEVTRLKNWTKLKKLADQSDNQSLILNKLIIVFIPEEYMKHIIKFQNGTPNERLFHIRFGLMEQKLFFKNYVDKVNELTNRLLEKCLTLKRAKKLATKGNHLHELPILYQKALKASIKSKSLKLKEPLENKIFKVHTETLELPDGRCLEFVLTVTAKYDEHVNHKNKIIHKYNLIFEWI